MKNFKNTLRYSLYLVLALVFADCSNDTKEQYTTFELIEELEAIHKRVGGNHDKIVNLYKLEIMKLEKEKTLLIKRAAYQDTLIQKQELAIALCIEASKH